MKPDDIPSYQPIDCDLYDELVLLATQQRLSQIRYQDAQGQITDLEGKVIDIFSRTGQEFLRLEQGLEIRLDQLIEVNGIHFNRD